MTNLLLTALFNKLIVIHNDRIEGYASAFNETDDLDLKECFNELTRTSRICKMELVSRINILGGTSVPKHKRNGNFLCLLNYIQAANKETGRQDILDSLNYGESISRCNYEQVLRANQRNLILEYSSMIKLHISQLELDHSRLRSLRDGLALTA